MTETTARLGESEHEVTQLELFFDLVFVFAITQVTSLITHEPTWLGALRGMLVLAAVWWAWNSFSWLTSGSNVDEGGVRLAILATTMLMLAVALAVPRAFERDAVLFSIAYFLVRVMHVVLSLIVSRDDPSGRDTMLRFTPTAFIGASSLIVAAFVNDDLRIVLWVAALVIDYSGPGIIGMGRGWRVAPEHFSERFGLIVLIALGESIVAIGVAAKFVLDASELAAAGLGIATISALWWLYFDVAALLARGRLAETDGMERARLARDAYSYIHLPIIAGIVLFAFALEATLSHPRTHLHGLAAFALCGGTALYFLAQVAFLWRSTGHIFRRRTIASGLLIVLIPAALVIPALASLALVAGTAIGVAAYEAISWREHRLLIRHPALADDRPPRTREAR
jgi:low temperature requirement protein LtrA